MGLAPMPGGADPSRRVSDINRQGTTILLVEQNAAIALSVATSSVCAWKRERRPDRRGRGVGRAPGCPARVTWARPRKPLYKE